MICVPLIYSGAAAVSRPQPSSSWPDVRFPLVFLARPQIVRICSSERGGSPPLIGANSFGRPPGPSLLTCFPAGRGLAGYRGEGRPSLSCFDAGQELG